jgi:hypothetical protein
MNSQFASAMELSWLFSYEMEAVNCLFVPLVSTFTDFYPVLTERMSLVDHNRFLAR